jgi:molecular chaperone GrpE
MAAYGLALFLSAPLGSAIAENRELIVTGVFRYTNTWPTAIALVEDGDQIEVELEAARTRAEEYLADLRRVAADFDNYRKRVARYAQAQSTHAAESLVQELLPVLDNLERALDASEHHEEAKVAEGVQFVKQQLAGLLARRGLEEIPCGPGDEFDPHVHEALSHQPSDQPEGAVAAVWQRGYRLGDRVVRAARVVVSSGPAAEEK